MSVNPRDRRLQAAPMVVLAVLATTAAAVPARGADWRAKVDPWVLSSTASGEPAEFLVYLARQADLSGAARQKGKAAKGAYVFERLRQVADATQGPVLAELRARHVEYRPYWVANMIWVRGDGAAVEAMAARADVAHVYANPRVHLAEPQVESAPSTPQAVEWGVQQIGAPDYWAQGFTGQGVVVGGQDTGYEWNHPALIDHYRGWNGAAADHNYNWHDSIHGGGGVCGADSPEPCDDNNHGTHTMGTMVGDDGGSNQIGVAPGARWMGCRNMDQGNGTPASYSECFQFFIAPTDLNGQNPDPTRAPDVINDSWVCPPSEGCVDPDVLRTVVENTRAAGIVVVASAGNSGPACSTVDAPPAIYEAALSVGATNSGDAIASFSSRGAVTVDGSSRLKPNVSAPGVSVRSSVRGGGYASFSGTSMAGPHVVGQVALLLSAVPVLAGDVDAVQACVEATAVPLTSSQTCGGVPGSVVPNNTYGFGRVQLVWPPPAVCTPVAIFADGFESGDLAHWD